MEYMHRHRHDDDYEEEWQRVHQQLLGQQKKERENPSKNNGAFNSQGSDSESIAVEPNIVSSKMESFESAQTGQINKQHSRNNRRRHTRDRYKEHKQKDKKGNLQTPWEVLFELSSAQNAKIDFYELAKTIHKELDSYFSFSIDTELILDSLSKLNKNGKSIETLKEVYRSLYDMSLEAHIRGRLKGDDLSKAIGSMTPDEPYNKTIIQGQLVEKNIKVTKATSFRGLVNLVRLAEDRLISAGYADIEDRIRILRGIYYGTNWSMDFQQEKSEMRNLGFKAFTASLTEPADPQAILGKDLFLALRNSPEVTDGKRSVDFGHLMIGLETRTKYLAREINLPNFGGTGLEATTWLGDLGGGAAMLAINRADGLAYRAKAHVFDLKNDYGAMVNLEGDIAAYVVAMNKKKTDDASYPNVKQYGYISDAIASYLLPANDETSSNEWTSRARTFFAMIGAKLDEKNGYSLNKKDELIKKLEEKIFDNATAYAVTRLSSHDRLTSTEALKVSKQIRGTSNEVAKIFVDMMERCAKDPSLELKAKLDPDISEAGKPEGALSDFEKVSKLAKEIMKKH